MLTSSNSHKRSQTYTFLSCLCENRIKKLKKTTFFQSNKKNTNTLPIVVYIEGKYFGKRKKAFD